MRIAAMAALLGLAAQEKQPPDVSFSKQVQPILNVRCIACHNPKDPDGGLDASTHAGLKKGGESGPAIVPGDPAKSLLATMISGSPPDMPLKDRPLQKAQIELIALWIRQGAKNN